MSVNVTIKGLDELNAKLAKIGKDIKPELTKATQKAVLYVHSTVPAYPATRPGQAYVRTGTLGRSITTEVKSLGSQVVGVIGTNVVYAPYVISEEAVGGRGPQAWFHKGRWYTLQGVVMKARDKVVEIYTQMLRDLIK